MRLSRAQTVEIASVKSSEGDCSQTPLERLREPLRALKRLSINSPYVSRENAYSYRYHLRAYN